MDYIYYFLTFGCTELAALILDVDFIAFFLLYKYYEKDLCLIGSIFYLIAGHGGSDGLHAYVHSLDDAVNDMV